MNKLKDSAGERPVDEEPMTNCCDVHFTYPGWPDSDLCSECFEHAGISEDDDDDVYKQEEKINNG